jgi:hypothetical protein
MHESFIPYRVAGNYLSNRLEKEGVSFPVVGVICGSGLSGLSKSFEGKILTVRLLLLLLLFCLLYDVCYCILIILRVSLAWN